MNSAHRERKQAIRSFMQSQYTDERLAQLLAHAQDGKLVYASCCCFVGAANADHALQGMNFRDAWLDETNHYYRKPLFWALTATKYYELVDASDSPRNDDALRRRILIPMIRAEQRRRARARARTKEFVETIETVFA